MNQENILRDLESLPPEAQKQVVDFISFLQSHYKPRIKKKKTNLADESFIGIWQNRNEMENSSEWVRNARMREWGK